MKELKAQITKTINCKVNGRSADITTANFILGCNGGCQSYCYVGRWNRPYIYVNTNTDDILESCNKWVERQPWPKIKNQTDDKYYTADIGCNVDIIRHWKDYDWQKVFKYFIDHPKLKATFATKYYGLFPLKINPENKIRIRFSMMPQVMSYILEPNTSLIQHRILGIEKYIDAGYDVHVNLSPIVVYNGWLEDYDELLSEIACNKYAKQLKFECIFLIHNKEQHYRNVKLYPEAEEVLWCPEIQEIKRSQYGGVNVRYDWRLKEHYIQQFKNIFSRYFDLKKIRYIF